MNKKIQQQSGFGIIAIIVLIVFLSGEAGLLYYIQNNQADLGPLVEASRAERAQEAQENGYPEDWSINDLPEYPSGELKKVREPGQATVETSDTPSQVKVFFDTEMTARGFTTQNMADTDLVSFTMYSKGSHGFTVQATVQEDNGLTKILLIYRR